MTLLVPEEKAWEYRELLERHLKASLKLHEKTFKQGLVQKGFRLLPKIARAMTEVEYSWVWESDSVLRLHIYGYVFEKMKEATVDEQVIDSFAGFCKMRIERVDDGARVKVYEGDKGLSLEELKKKFGVK